MNIIYWNARGLGNLESRLVLKKLCLSHKPDLVFISEPWIQLDKISERFWRSLNLRVFTVNNRNAMLPNIWCACAKNIYPKVISISVQQVSIFVMV